MPPSKVAGGGWNAILTRAISLVTILIMCGVVVMIDRRRVDAPSSDITEQELLQQQGFAARGYRDRER